VPLRSNIPEIKYSITLLIQLSYDRAIENQKTYEGYCVIAGDNFAQGSSRNMQL
jgi:aconitate hydratase